MRNEQTFNQRDPKTSCYFQGGRALDASHLSAVITPRNACSLPRLQRSPRSAPAITWRERSHFGQGRGESGAYGKIYAWACGESRAKRIPDTENGVPGEKYVTWEAQGQAAPGAPGAGGVGRAQLSRQHGVRAGACLVQRRGGVMFSSPRQHATCSPAL